MSDQPVLRIDLHAHSTASDGTLTPAELVTTAARCGLDVLALTDHETTDGWAEAAAACPDSLTLVPGTELSCQWTGSAEPVACHMLGYWFDPAEPRLASAMAEVREGRTARALRMVSLLAADGIHLSWDEVLAQAGGGTIGRPHIARVMVRHGIVTSVDAAFAPDWLGERYHVPKSSETDAATAVQLINEAGGVAVLAHPLAGRRAPVLTDEAIVELAAAGLAGLEVDHPDHSPRARTHARDLAATLGLVGTGASDFHGANKAVPLAACTTDPIAFGKLRALSPRARSAESGLAEP